MQIIVFLALAFSIVIAVFAVQNTTPVTVTFLTARVEGVAASVLVLISSAMGAGVMLLLGLAREIRIQIRHRTLSQQLRAAESRVRDLEAQSKGALTAESAPTISNGGLPPDSSASTSASTR